MISLDGLLRPPAVPRPSAPSGAPAQQRAGVATHCIQYFKGHQRVYSGIGSYALSISWKHAREPRPL